MTLLRHFDTFQILPEDVCASAGRHLSRCRHLNKAFEDMEYGAVAWIVSAGAPSHLHMVCVKALDSFKMLRKIEFGGNIIDNLSLLAFA